MTAESCHFPTLDRAAWRTRFGGVRNAVRFAVQIALASAAALRYRMALGRAIAAFDPAIVQTTDSRCTCWAHGRSGCDLLSCGIFTTTWVARRMTTMLLRWRQWCPWCLRRHGHGVTNSASVAADATRALANGTRVVTVGRNGVDLDRLLDRAGHARISMRCQGCRRRQRTPFVWVSWRRWPAGARHGDSK